MPSEQARPSPKVLLTKQTTTSSSSKVFDVSQFKRCINKYDVSLTVIEELQHEFGTDMAGAIDRFHDMENEAASKSSKIAKNVGEIRDGGTNKFVEMETVNEDPFGRKEFVIRDRYWNPYRREYVTKKPAEPKESNKNKRYVIFARRDYEPNMKTFNTVILVYGKILRNALRNIFNGAMNFSLTDNENSELRDARFLYWAKPELELLNEHYKSVEDKVAVFEIRAGLNLIEKDYKDMICLLPSLLPHSISFEHLWSLIPPGSLVVSQHDLDFTDTWCVLGCAIREAPGGNFLSITAECIVWDGGKMAYTSKTLKIYEFSGFVTIGSLPYIPLKYHPDRQAVIQKVRQRSNKAINFWTPGFQIQEHQGTGIAEVSGKVRRHAFSGRVIIDPAMMRSTQPWNSIMPSSWRMRNIPGKRRTRISDLTTKEEYPLVLEELLKGANQGFQTEGTASELLELLDSSESSSDSESFMHPTRISTDEALPGLVGASARSPRDTVQLSDEQMLLVSSLLYGYSLQDGMWGAFAVDRVSDVVWNNNIFPSLVMEPSLKNNIYQLVIAHSNDATNFDDFVKGKGKGLIGLLFGPPGSGKTLTAEAVAETAKMPLYMVSSGALGDDPADIEDKLSAILKLASHWKAVLLIDEADVFLAERTPTDIERNAIVSIFLRELEYYQGILLLTTNQAQVIDEAFQSRIHFSVHYPLLDSVARRTIWANFLDNVRECQGVDVDITSDDTLVLAELPLNGRQIKNAVSIAVKIAGNSKERTITSKAIISTAKLLQSQDYHGKRSKAGWDEETLDRNYMKAHTASTQNTDAVPVKPMHRRLGSMRWSHEAVCIIAVAALFALDFLLGAKLN